MRKAMIVLVIGLLISSGLALAAEKVYQLRTVIDFAVDPAKCAADGGRGALVAELDETGALASEWEAYCVLEVK